VDIFGGTIDIDANTVINVLATSFTAFNLTISNILVAFEIDVTNLDATTIVVSTLTANTTNITQQIVYSIATSVTITANQTNYTLVSKPIQVITSTDGHYHFHGLSAGSEGLEIEIYNASTSWWFWFHHDSASATGWKILTATGLTVQLLPGQTLKLIGKGGKWVQTDGTAQKPSPNCECIEADKHISTGCGGFPKLSEHWLLTASGITNEPGGVQFADLYNGEKKLKWYSSCEWRKQPDQLEIIMTVGTSNITLRYDPYANFAIANKLFNPYGSNTFTYVPGSSYDAYFQAATITVEPVDGPAVEIGDEVGDSEGNGLLGTNEDGELEDVSYADDQLILPTFIYGP
jgi:hypothetical protein